MSAERILVTGSSGHLGEALVRVLRGQGRDVTGMDLLASGFTAVTGSVTDRRAVRASLAGVTGVLHAATLHKPHIGSHGRQAFVDTNITGTLVLLEEAVRAGVGSFALARAPALGFGRYIVSATTPFTPADLPGLAADAPAVVHRLFPGAAAEYARRGWAMFPAVDRVYVNARARAELGWQPRYDFAAVLRLLQADQDPRSPLALAVGAKGYHAAPTGPYTVR